MARVAFLLPNFDIGGAERVALELIKALVQRGNEVDLVLMREEGELLSVLPSDVNVVSLGARRLRNTLLPFARYLRDRKPDVVHARMWPLTLIPIVSRHLPVPAYRIVISDDGILSKAYQDRGPLHRIVLRSSIALLYPRADARLAVSEGVADDLARLGGLDRRSVVVIHNPIAPPQPGLDSRGINWTRGGARILAVGNLIPVKNYPLLFAAFARLIETRPASLVILGEGAQRSELESLAMMLGIASFITLPGAMPDPAPYYATADVLVLSSDSEGFGNVLVEAMHHGLTVVSTDCPTGPREILDGGRFGCLTPCGDADALAAAIAQACDRPLPAKVLRTRAQVLSGPHVIDRYLELLLPGPSR